MSVPPSADSTPTPASELSPDDRLALLALARQAVASALGLPAPDPARRPAFARVGGAFVTVHVDGELRGCIGIPEASRPLGDVIPYCARAAAFEDPRFRPLDATELDRLHVEISVLSPLTPLRDALDLHVGRHGLIVEQGGRRGLLLPQVATEHRWSAGEFLRHTCRKAGLPPDAWERGASLSVFEADVFSDTHAAGR
jgi:AmmeMemoRadiSam system protein A